MQIERPQSVYLTYDDAQKFRVLLVQLKSALIQNVQLTNAFSKITLQIGIRHFLQIAKYYMGVGTLLVVILGHESGVESKTAGQYFQVLFGVFLTSVYFKC